MLVLPLTLSFEFLNIIIIVIVQMIPQTKNVGDNLHCLSPTMAHVNIQINNFMSIPKSD